MVQDESVFKKIENFEINGKFPLHIAVITGQLRVVDFYLRKNFHINKLDSDGNSPLYYAIRNQY